MQLPQPILNELGIEDENVLMIPLPELGSSPGDTFKAKARDGRIATFKLVSETPKPPMHEDCCWGSKPVKGYQGGEVTMNINMAPQMGVPLNPGMNQMPVQQPTSV